MKKYFIGIFSEHNQKTISFIVSKAVLITLLVCLIVSVIGFVFMQWKSGEMAAKIQVSHLLTRSMEKTDYKKGRDPL